MQYSDFDLKEFLDCKVNTFNTLSYLESNPLQIPHRLDTIEDIEIAAFLTAQLA